MMLWVVILVAGLLTLLTRMSFIALPMGNWIQPWMRRALQFVPPAVLSAITLPELLVRDGQLAVTADNFRLIAGIAAIVVAWRTRQVLPTLIAGMMVLWGLRLL
jgi:branched-subunit amino acid transport protein